MRDPKRLDDFYKKLKEIHKKAFPDWRFGQFMMNFLSWLGKGMDPFFPEEDAMLKYLEQFVEGRRQPDTKEAENIQ